MGYSTRPGTSIRDFWPDNTSTTLYIASTEISLTDLLKGIRNHFGEDVDFDRLTISSENIHTSCITYDLYDPLDWTDFIVVQLA